MTDICHECANPSWTGKTIEAPALPSGGEGGTSNFNALENRPKYDGMRMTGNTDIPNTARDVERLDGDIEDIQALIPETASTENQLADKDFVNSSVATNTANFVGTYDSLEELEAVENPSNNDYGFVISTDEYGNTVYNRYKYVASVESWEFEYALNNSSFTAAQWAAINSGITSGNVEKINAILEIKSTGDGLVLENNGQLRQKLYTETGDNTDASMTQKAASDAIDAIWGKPRTLTELDYNANYNSWDDTDPTNFNCVALWKLPRGFYRSTVKTYMAKDAGEIYIFTPNQATTESVYLLGRGSNNLLTAFRFGYASGNGFSTELYMAATNNSGTLFDWWNGVNAENNLTSNSAAAPLSAKQGKVLADMIGTLSNLNTTAKTNAVAAINEVLGYKGQARKLTADDYNWNHTTQTTTNPDCINLSLLPPGLYYRESSAVVIEPYVYSASSDYLTFLVSKPDRNGKNDVLAISADTSYGWRIFPYRNGLGNGEQQVILSRDVVNNLTTVAPTKPLSANQGRVLKGLVDGKQDKLTAGNGIEIDNQSVISIATISTEDWSALWQ